MKKTAAKKTTEGEKTEKKKTAKKRSEAVRKLQKWLILLAVILCIGGVFAFGLIAFIANLAGETADTYDPIWMIYMIPLMFLIATPITIFIAKTVDKHVNVLSEAIGSVADGKTDVYIPTAGAGAFTRIYEGFNKMAAEIAGIQSLRNELVDNFSHELKTPVASINGFAKMILEEKLPEDKQKKYLEIIVKESDKLADLARNNLLLSKVDAQEIITDKKPYNLGQQIKDIAIAMEGAWSKKNINLACDIPDIEFIGDANLMESVWQNLLSNAIKFTPRNGEINITMDDDGKQIIIKFQDSGIGMNEEVRNRIFERYFQGESSHAGEGNGLGLSIASRVIKLCNGNITVESKESEGSIFTVILPKN